MKTIEESWQLFRTQVISPAAPAIQVKEMRIAFYAGFSSMLRMLIELDALDQSQAERILLLLYAEAAAFGASLY